MEIQTQQVFDPRSPTALPVPHLIAHTDRHTYVCKCARTEPRAPAHPVTPASARYPARDARLPAFCTPLASPHARARTHALPAPPHRAEARDVGGGWRLEGRARDSSRSRARLPRAASLCEEGCGFPFGSLTRTVGSENSLLLLLPRDPQPSRPHNRPEG